MYSATSKCLPILTWKLYRRSLDVDMMLSLLYARLNRIFSAICQDPIHGLGPYCRVRLDEKCLVGIEGTPAYAHILNKTGNCHLGREIEDEVSASL